MRRVRGALRVTAASLVLLVSACSSVTTTPSASPTPRHGGTLRVVIALSPDAGPPGYRPPDASAFDFLATPTNGSEAAEVLRCCLARTLFSYSGRPTAEGGAQLQPDVASGPGQVSADGLTWTFHLKSGLRYAPPLQGVTVSAADFVRALQRQARVGSSLHLFDDIVGFVDYQEHKAEGITGALVPDAHTLVLHLSTPEGDLPYRLALPSMVPLPASPLDPQAPFGIATGHDDGFTGVFVSSGPYMVEGSDRIDQSLPPDQQGIASGLALHDSITLVRNPSWRADQDQLRGGYADRIVLRWRTSDDEAAADIDADRADVMFGLSRPPQVPRSVLTDWMSHPDKGRVDIQTRDGVRYISMNLAAAPFDDVHVRRALAFAIDRKALEDAFGGAAVGTVTGHLALDSMEDNALFNYDPFKTPDSATRIRMARAEMALSTYDPGHTGRCTAGVCAHVRAVALTSPQTPGPMLDVVRQNLLDIGIHLDATSLEGKEYFSIVTDPVQDPPMAMFWGFGKDYPNGSDFFTQEFSHDALIGGADLSLVGATPEELRGWGYSTTSLPSVDDRINACLPLTGQAQTHCWTNLDQYMTEKVVALVPFVSESYVAIIPRRVVSYSFDQAWTLPALDRIAIAH